MEQLRETVNDMLGVNRFGAGGEFGSQHLPRDFNSLHPEDLRVPFVGVDMNHPSVENLSQSLPDIGHISVKAANSLDVGELVIF